jgi:hypothetical protein
MGDIRIRGRPAVRSRRKSRLSPAATELMSAEIAAGDFGP